MRPWLNYALSVHVHLMNPVHILWPRRLILGRFAGSLPPGVDPFVPASWLKATAGE